MGLTQAAPINVALTARSELLSPAEAVAIAAENYGLIVTAQKLAGEKDSNFRLETSSGDEYLLKAVNPGEAPAVTNLHTMALMHVAQRDPGMPVQRVVLTKEGLPEFQLALAEDDVRTVRLVTFSKGLLQRKSVQTPVQRRNIGGMLARLQLALQDFEHPAEDHFSTWDLKNVLSLREMVEDLPASEGREELRSWLDVFEADILPELSVLRSQLVHNDLNSDNIVVDPISTDTVTGIIDFGDMVKTPVLFDVAVAAAYQLTEAADPLQAAIDFLQGFHERRQLTEHEIGLLFRCVVVRMAMRIIITEWRAVRFPENRQYILRNTPQAWTQFHRLTEIPNERATHAIAAALK
ncbi:aminoglycoside phosphotransferase protein (plasmid) [Rhizobium phaseoli]|uniref:phosphotransferase n=1 Tax=Rhizobium phaseoli TaxID=396 RepID=UPI0007EB2997|nr:phosphotransferase [Rhizobium phaseoli]ANL51038.1 aminoglycoside phosphotransferase protein [Rhizobium phaseoli]